VYEIFARALHRAIRMRCMGFLRGLRTELLVWGVEVYEIFARALHRAISMRCMGFLRGLRTELIV
jgi:hypothetical protein